MESQPEIVIQADLTLKSIESMDEYPSNIFSREEEEFTLISKLQKLLKEEYLLLSTEQEQKEAFEKKLQATIFAYYRSSVSIGESTFRAIQHQRNKIQRTNSNLQQIKNSEKVQKYEQEKRLFEDQGFGNVYSFVKDILLSISKDPYLMMILIEKYQNTTNIESFSSLFKVIVNSMYENIVDDDVFNKDLIKLIVFCLKKTIADKKHYFEINFQEENLIQLFLYEITERSDTKNYAKQVIKNTLLEIAKIDHVIDFRKNEEDERLMPEKHLLKLSNKESSKSYQQIPIKVKGPIGQAGEKKSKIRQYSEGLRQYDQKIRKGAIIKRKYKNCASDELLSYLGINEQINFPCFSCSSSEDMKVQQEINKQLGLMMNISDLKHQSLFHPDSLILKNIVLVFFNDLFKMLYSMPPLIRISCKILHRYLSQSFNNKNCVYVIADFVINFWLTSAMQVDVLAEAAKFSPYLRQNVEEVMHVIKKIVKDNSKDINQGFIKDFHLLVTNLKVSIANYIHQVLNIDGDKIQFICEDVEKFLATKKLEPRKSTNFIKSYCVCISMTDIKKLLEIIKGAEQELLLINSKIVNRAQRIQMMSSGSNVFGDKEDKATGKVYRAHKSYVLFSELELPPKLSIDYDKFYRDAFKNSKVKNVIKQVLLSLAEVETYEQFYTSNRMQDFIYSLDIREDSDSLNSIDHIPLRLKIEYLQILSRGVKIGSIIKELYEETVKRFENFNEIWKTSKECYLKAISSLNFQIEKLNNKQKYIRSQIKRRKLQEFFNKTEIKLCLTSPKTREKEIILKTTLMKELIEEYREKLWLENQSSCIHTALNLDFIKSLTGEPERQKMKYQCHFNHIMKFPEILCALPEVKQRFSSTEDSIGIKDVFFEFVEYIRNVIKNKEQDYAILLENIEWLQENIELKISKKLYDKLYPKYPLYDDIAMYLRLKTLDWIQFSHLKIEPELRNRRIWEVAAANLRTIDKMRTAAEKLHCIEETAKIIANSYMLMSKSQKPATADDLSPLMILVLIMAAPKRLVSSINFIESFASPSKLLSKQGYCLTQLKGALHFCDTVSPETISIFENEANNYIEFNRKIYEKQIHYGIYFMLGRRKDSPQTQKKKLEYLKQYFKKSEID